MSPVTRDRISFHFRNDVGLCLLRDFEQVSKVARKWNIKINNPKGTNIEFTEDGGQSLNGKWAFLNKVADESNGELFKENRVFFGLAVSADKTIETTDGSYLANGITKLFVCSNKQENFGDGGTEVKNSGRGGDTGFCKDISNDWYFGVVIGDYYDASFIVRKTAVGKRDWYWSPEWVTKEFEWKGTEGLNPKLVEMLKLATKSGNEFHNGANKQSTQGDGMCKNGWDVNGADTNKVCFQWVDMADEGGDNKLKSSNCKRRDSFDGCSIGIIDVSRYTREHQRIFLFQNEKNF